MNCTSTVDGTVICGDSRHYSKLNLLSLGVLCTVCIPEGKYFRTEVEKFTFFPQCFRHSLELANCSSFFTQYFMKSIISCLVPN